MCNIQFFLLISLLLLFFKITILVKWCIHVFGCLAYACTIGHARTKFDPRGRQCVYIGHSTVSKGYILLDVFSQQLFLSRNVMFVETLFPFKHSLPSVVSSDAPSSPITSSLAFEDLTGYNYTPYSESSTSVLPLLHLLLISIIRAFHILLLLLPYLSNLLLGNVQELDICLLFYPIMIVLYQLHLHLINLLLFLLMIICPLSINLLA